MLQEITPDSRPILDPVLFRRRLTEEVERAIRYQRFVSLLYVPLVDIPKATAEAVFSTAVSSVRVVDIVGRFADGSMGIILPETGAKAEVPATRLLEQLKKTTSEIRGGLVKCPNNGVDTDALIEEARKAASIAKRDALGTLPDQVSTINISKDFPTVIAADPVMKRLFVLVRKLARSNLSVLVTGETGVGKEIVAQAIHRWSNRSTRPFLAVNCAAIPETLLESELFGYEKGAFSGAESAKPGLIESASGGTLFLDEISEATPGIQAGLLRVLETLHTRRLGATRETKVDVRFIAATNRELDTALREGRFRSDLYFRLNAARIAVPSLKERTADIIPLAEAFLNISRDALDKPEMYFTERAQEMLQRYGWPGNVRELKNLMGFLSATLTGPDVDAEDLQNALGTDGPETTIAPTAAPLSEDASKPRFLKLSDEIKALERKRIEEALIAAHGVRKEAAALIGMPLRTLVTKIKLYNLTRVGMSDEDNA